MEFRTAIKSRSAETELLRHDSCVVMLGSCFSDNIGQKLANGLMDVTVNPFGTTYNPLSIAECIDRLIECKLVGKDDLFAANGLWNSFLFHSRYSGSDADGALAEMNSSINIGHERLARCSHVFITLGTSFVFRLNDTGEVVNNCHKLPAHKFTRLLCGIEEISHALDHIAESIHRFNSNARIVFTVSPIRHIADGLEMNQLSKSQLIVGAHGADSRHADYCSYFPAYEIMMDDLRDYRFYASDMLHPSDVAIDYIWEFFKNTYFSKPERDKVEQCERFAKRLAHRASNSEATIRFKQETTQALNQLITQYPHIANLKIIKPLIT